MPSDILGTGTKASQGAFVFLGSILNGVDDDFSTPFFVFTKYLRNAIK